MDLPPAQAFHQSIESSGHLGKAYEVEALGPGMARKIPLKSYI